MFSGFGDSVARRGLLLRGTEDAIVVSEDCIPV